MNKGTKVGFIGLGQMGKHMAYNLVKAGVALTVCDRSPEQFSRFRSAGAKTTHAAADLAACDVIFLCLPGDSAVGEALFGEEGVFPLLDEGRLVVDCSTISVTGTKKIASALAAKNVDFLDAPVSGMEARAKDGTLTIMVGGRAAVLARVEPLLKHMGNNIIHAGDVGCGQLTKLVNQLLFDINAAALAEIMPMAVKLGLDPAKTANVVNSGTGRSYASEFFLPRILENNFGDGYPMRHAYKDLVSGALVGAEEGIPLPVLQAATATYQTALLQGYGSEDKGAMIKVYEELLGVRVRKAE